MRRELAIATLLLTFAASASASETITYSYDAKGRLVQVAHSGSVNNGTQTTFSHDKADNRTRVVTQGAPR